MLNDNAINICSRALNAIGAESISSFDDGTDEAKIANAKYETAKKDLLAVYPWTFNTAEVYLGRLNSDSLAKYTYLYELPTDWLRTLAIKQGATMVPFCYRQGKINTDYETASIEYLYDIDETDMPAYFVSLLIDRLARDFLIPVTGKNDDYAIFDRIYQNNLATAKNVDAQSKSPSVIDTSLLLRVR